MENIYEPNASFLFEQLTLTSPTIISGGNHFIKYLIKGNPLYIQPPKCKTRGGIAKSGKRMYCDLIFNNENEQFIRWLEDLEAYTCKTIFEHREKWFETEMELSDVENYFSSPIKSYKSGKFHLIRTNVPTRLGKMVLKIYNEEENEIDPTSINENAEIITILEFQGVKCSARSFQIEIELKQMLTLKPSILFEKCILTNNKQIDNTSKYDLDRTPSARTAEDTRTAEDIKTGDMKTEDVKIAGNTNNENVQSNSKINNAPTEDLGNSNTYPAENEYLETFDENDYDYEKTDNENIEETNLEKTDNISGPYDFDPQEFEIDLDKVSLSETVQIKPRNDVYYEMYRQARQKAKLARNMALSAYLEAKQIKNAYMLDDTRNTDDSDTDDEYFENKINK